MKKCLLVMLALLANIAVSGCADDQARAQIADINARLSQMDTANNQSAGQRSIAVQNKLDDLQNQIDQLNGSVATVGNNQKTYQATQEQLNQSLQQQLQGIEKSGGSDTTNGNHNVVAADSATGANASAPATGTTKHASLKTALSKMKKRDFPGSIVVLKKIIADKDNNSSETIADATYYLSIAYAANAQYKESILTARRYIAGNHDGKNVPDAMRIVYISQSQLGMKKSATKTANLIIKEYPNSEAAKKLQSN